MGTEVSILMEVPSDSESRLYAVHWRPNTNEFSLLFPLRAVSESWKTGKEYWWSDLLLWILMRTWELGSSMPACVARVGGWWALSGSVLFSRFSDDWLCCALSIPKCFNCPNGMGSPLRKKLVRNCWNAKIVTSIEFMLVLKVIFVGLILYLKTSEPIFLLHAITGSFFAPLEIINNSSLC